MTHDGDDVDDDDSDGDNNYDGDEDDTGYEDGSDYCDEACEAEDNASACPFRDTPTKIVGIFHLESFRYNILVAVGGTCFEYLLHL